MVVMPKNFLGGLQIIHLCSQITFTLKMIKNRIERWEAKEISQNKEMTDRTEYKFIFCIFYYLIEDTYLQYKCMTLNIKNIW